MSIDRNRNVYVGHRYVPKIIGEWDKQKNYEGLSIVTHQGTSYTSKKGVPVGVDILNTEYWTVTGNYNAQVETYRQDVRDMEDRVNEDLNSVNEQMAQNTDDIINIKRKEYDIWDFLEHVPMHNTLDRSEWDWTKAIQEALKTIPNNAKLVFPPGIYNHGDGVINKKPSGYRESGTYNGYTRYEPIDGVAYPYYKNNDSLYGIGDSDIGEDRRLFMDGLKNVLIEGYGAVIKAHKDNSAIRMNGGFVLNNIENLRVKGLMYNGNIVERKPFLVDSAWINRQHGFDIGLNCKDIVFEDVSSNECLMDGFYIHSGTLENVTLLNCNAYRNYRQGVSVGTSKQAKIKGGVYAESGTIYGTAPMAGIDLEMQNGEIDAVIVEGVTLKDNVGNGLSLHWNTINSVVRNCTFINNSLYEDRNGTKNNDIIENTFYNGVINCHGGGTRIIGNKLYLIANENSGSWLSSIGSDDSENKFKNGLSRKGEIKDNYVQIELTNNIDHITVYGVLANIGFETNEVEGNTFINAFNATGTGTQVVNGKALTFKNNKFLYNGSLENSGTIRAAKEIGYNEISPTYKFDGISDRSYKVDGVTVDGFKYSKDFNINTRIPTNKAFDIVIDGDFENTLSPITLTLNTGGNSYGLLKTMVRGSEQSVIATTGTISERIVIESPKISGGKLIITFKSPTPEESDPNRYGIEGSIGVEVDTTHYKVDVKDIVMSESYNV